MLLLFGVNGDNILVQNTVAWGYTIRECGGVPLNAKEDALGWIRLEDYTPPSAAFIRV